MRRFGLDIKNKDEASEQKQQRLVNQTTPEEDAKRAARIARFGITDLTPKTVENKRTMKFKRKFKGKGTGKQFKR